MNTVLSTIKRINEDNSLPGVYRKPRDQQVRDVTGDENTPGRSDPPTTIILTKQVTEEVQMGGVTSLPTTT